MIKRKMRIRKKLNEKEKRGCKGEGRGGTEESNGREIEIDNN